MSSVWVLLRGLTRESGHWGAFPTQLARHLKDAHIIALDLPGNGTLNAQASPTRIPDMVSSCRAWLRARGVAGPYHLLAMSLGAMVAVAWADMHPAEVAGCVLINTSLRGISPFYRRLRPASYAALARLLFGGDALAAETTILRLTSASAPPAVLDDWVALRRSRPVSRRNALRQFAAAARFRAPPTPPAVPILLLCGAADRLVDPQCSSALADRWQLPLQRHLSAGHDLPLDDGEWVARRVVEWLDGNRRSQTR